ncbi:MAG: hypothetical protein AB8C46_02760 [Burkholderiaceae bacterium]
MIGYSWPVAGNFFSVAGKQIRAVYGRVVALVRWLELVDQVRRERRLLASMGERQLGDLGINQATAENESARGAFDLPKERLHADK